MSENNIEKNGSDWPACCGLTQVLRSARYAIRMDTLALAMLAIVLTCALGSVINWGSTGLSPSAIDSYIASRDFDQPYEEPAGDWGALSVLGEHSKRSIAELMGSVLPGRSLAAGTGIGSFLEVERPARPLEHLSNLGAGVLWLFHHHWFVAALFSIGLLLIWSLAGGAICRIVGVQIATGDIIDPWQGLRYSLRRLWDGFFLAPMVPIGLILCVLLLLTFGGVILAIPWIGDLLAGVLFPLSILGGLAIAALLVGLLVGGHLYAPAVACDGADGFDAFSRSLAYVFSRPWRSAFYGIVSLIYSAFCFAAAKLMVGAGLWVTRSAVGLGTSPFGWWRREVNGVSMSKLEALWPIGGESGLYESPQWSQLGFFEYFSAGLIWLWVAFTVAMVWALLASLYYSSSTVVYFLLRREVDGTDMSDIISDEAGDEPTGVSAPPVAAQTVKSIAATDHKRSVRSSAGSTGAIASDLKNPKPHVADSEAPSEAPDDPAPGDDAKKK